MYSRRRSHSASLTETLQRTLQMKHTIILPDLGQTTSEAKVVKWLKAVGERLAAGEPLLEVETDKATMDVEAYVGGYLRKKLAQEGEMVSAMSPVAILTDTADEGFEEEVEVSKPQIAVSQTVPKPAATSVPSSRPLAAAPAARLRAKELGIELSSVPGTGPGGLITKADVERFAEKTSFWTPLTIQPCSADQPFFGWSAAVRSSETKSRRPPETAVCATPTPFSSRQPGWLLWVDWC